MTFLYILWSVFGMVIMFASFTALFIFAAFIARLLGLE